MTQQTYWVIGCFFILFASSGCNAKSDYAPVRGKVFYRGEPLKFGSILFQPESGQPSRSTIRPDGSFDLWTEVEGDGARIGRNEVRITCYEGQSPNAKPASNGEPSLGRLLIPVRYTRFGQSGLTFVVEPTGHQDVVFNLTDE